MRETGLIYRPPYEADSLLLQVTTGCSHARCSFCSMYTDIPFSVRPMEEVESALDEAARHWPDVRRVFLENGDPFALPADRLMQIADAIHRRLPGVKTIAMYASIRNIRGKTDRELLCLREKGINELNIGVESGLDAALHRMNKGHTAAEAAEQLLRLKTAGFDYIVNLILGCAGAGLWAENARASAELLNASQPFMLFMGTLHAEPGCTLYEDMKSGTFDECTFGQLLDEEELLLSRTQLENTLVLSTHPSNVVPMQGILPGDRDAMLDVLHTARFQLQDRLDTYPVRGPEGMILNGLMNYE